MSLFDIFRINEFKERIAQLEREKAVLEQERIDLGFKDYNDAKQAIEVMQREADRDISQKQQELNRRLSEGEASIERDNQIIVRLREEIEGLRVEEEKLSKQNKTTMTKLIKVKELYKAIEYSLDFFHAPVLYNRDENEFERMSQADSEILEEMLPSVILNLHCMDVKDLRTAYRNNEKQIDKLVEAYKGRYTTKTNQTIYELMVIALRAELQNVLYVLKYDKLEKGVESIKLVTAKYLAIATKGNQQIAPTITRFIGELEYLFINAVKIEYNYYVKKEQARQEQFVNKCVKRLKKGKLLSRRERRLKPKSRNTLKRLIELRSKLLRPTKRPLLFCKKSCKMWKIVCLMLQRRRKRLLIFKMVKQVISTSLVTWDPSERICSKSA